MSTENAAVIFFDNLKREDVALVGGKNSSLGEMVQSLAAQGIAVQGIGREPYRS